MQQSRLRRIITVGVLVCFLFGFAPYRPVVAADAGTHTEWFLPPEPWATLVRLAPWMREPFVRPEVAQRMPRLRATILAAAQRHNQPQRSGMDSCTFAETIATILHTEQTGWLEDALPILRPLTPAYQQLQIELNRRFATDLTVWPANLRPSVAREILRGETPLPDPYGVLDLPLVIAGSRLDGQRADPVALTDEISDPFVSVEYLAANLERGVARARFEGVPVTWEALATWHNQGIVAPGIVQGNTQARYYLWRAAAYRTQAAELLACRNR